MWYRRCEIGDMRQEMWDRRHETGDVIKYMWERRHEQQILDRRRETWDRRRETGEIIQETWYTVAYMILETGDMRQEAWDRRCETNLGKVETELENSLACLSERPKKVWIMQWRSKIFWHTPFKWLLIKKSINNWFIAAKFKYQRLRNGVLTT